MVDELGGITQTVVQLALDAAVLRHKVIANNIANINTPGYRPQQVRFEDYLVSAVSGIRADYPHRAAELEMLSRRIDGGELVRDAGSASVALDEEMVRLAENTVRYEALLKGLSKRSAIIRLAIGPEGER